MARTFKGIVRDLSGRGGHATKGRVMEGTEVDSPPVGEKGEPVVMEKRDSK